MRNCDNCRHKDKCRGIEEILRAILDFEYELAQMKVEEMERIRERILKLGQEEECGFDYIFFLLENENLLKQCY